MKRIIKELVICLIIALGITAFFIGTQLLSNYIHYGTFLF